MRIIWRETIGIDGEPISPKDAFFYKVKSYWLHVKIVSKEYTLYVYRMYLMNIELNISRAHLIYTRRMK